MKTKSTIYSILILVFSTSFTNPTPIPILYPPVQDIGKEILSSKITAGAAVFIPKRGMYVFQGKQYYKYTLDFSGKNEPSLLKEYPKDLPGGWRGLPKYFQSGIDAAVYHPPTRKTYFFKGGQYIRLTDITVDKGYPKNLPGGWQGLPKVFQRDIDAAMYFTEKGNPNQGYIVLVKNGNYVAFSNFKKIASGKFKDLWDGVPANFENEINAVTPAGLLGKYIFAGNQYVFAPGTFLDKHPQFSSLLKVGQGNTKFAIPRTTRNLRLKEMDASPWSIASLCPNGNMCPELFHTLFDVKIRSYVPPRFTFYGDGLTTMSMNVENMESHHQYKNLTRVGCRYNIQRIKNQIRDDMDVWEQAADLLNATRDQWQGFYDDAKGFTAGLVADGVCGVVDPSPSCKSAVSSVVEAGINVGLAAAGIPPEFPDIEQLRENGIEYLATQGATYAIGGVDKEFGKALSPALRAAAYATAYKVGKEELKKQLDDIVPSASYNREDPATWGTILQMYAPHNAHLYIEIKVKNRKAYELILGEKFVSYPTLQLQDDRYVYRKLPSIPFPEFIPEEGIIIPIELRPAKHTVVPNNGEWCLDCKSAAQIPGEKISNRYLQEKFSIFDLVKQQYNMKPIFSTANMGVSDWDLFYEPKYLDDRSRTTFSLKGNFGFKDGSTVYPSFKNTEMDEQKVRLTTVWDRITGEGVLKQTTSAGTVLAKRKYVLKNYYGRQDPPCPCSKMVKNPDCDPLKANIIWKPE